MVWGINKILEIAKTQPQAAYAAFTSGCKHRFSWFIRIIDYINNFMSPVEKMVFQYRKNLALIEVISPTL